MFKTLTRTALLLLCCAFTRPLAAQWVQMSSPTTVDLNDVQLYSPDHGWAVGDSGTFLKMTSRAAGFQNMTTGIQKHLISVAFFDSLRGYVLPDFGGPYYTSDGGQTWAEDSILASVCYGQQVRAHGDLLYVVTQGCFGGSRVYTKNMITGDTTELFDYTPGPLPFPMPFYRTVGFPGAAGSAIVMGEENGMGRTTDGGDNWTLSPPNDTLFDWQSVCFTPTGTGYAITRDIWWPLHKSTDQGLTWVVDSSWAATFFYPYCNDVDYPRDGLGSLTAEWGFSDDGLLIDYWPNSTFGYYITDKPMRALDRITDSLGVAVGDSGTIYYREGGPLAIAEPARGLPFTLAPNPSDSQAQLQWEAQSAGTLQVYALDGRELFRADLRAGQRAIALPEMRPGAYLVRLDSDGRRAVQRWVVR